MKVGQRKNQKKLFWSNYVVEEGVDPENIENDPHRIAVRQAILRREDSLKLFQDCLSQYIKYKIDNFTAPLPSLDHEVVWTRKPKSKGKVEDYIAEVKLDFIFQCLADYLKGTPADVAFGLDKLAGNKKMPNSANEITIAKFFHTKLLEGKSEKKPSYDSALFETMKEFNLSEKRVKFINAKYSNFINDLVKYKVDIAVFGTQKVLIFK